MVIFAWVMENKPMEVKLSPTVLTLYGEAKKGNWALVERDLHDESITPEDLEWAMKKAQASEDNEGRDYAATLLNTSTRDISDVDQAWLMAWMTEDKYHIVRYRLAIALYQRGNRAPEVEAMMQEAAKDMDVGDLAIRYLTQD